MITGNFVSERPGITYIRDQLLAPLSQRLLQSTFTYMHNVNSTRTYLNMILGCKRS